VLAKPADVYNVDLATRGIVVALGEKTQQVDRDDVRAARQRVPLPRGSIGRDERSLHRY
jgi:hypothetical protein